MTLQNTNNTYPNSQEKSLNGVLNINNIPEPNTEALELFFLYMEDDLAPLEVPFVPRKEHETSKLALNFRTSPKKFKNVINQLLNIKTIVTLLKMPTQSSGRTYVIHI